ncbi:hypothetical protein ES703_64706 [subsurface metagenome]
MSFMSRTAKHLLTIKAAREIGKEIEKAGLDNLKTLAEANISIVGTYLNGCSPQDKARHRRDLNALLGMGVTPDILLSELARQISQLAPIMQGKEGYKKTEVEKLFSFLKEEKAT